MDCPWRQTFASVYILVSLNNYHVSSQNVLPTGAQSVAVLRDPLCAGLTTPAPQQMNLFIVPPNGIKPELMSFGPCPIENQLRRPILQDVSRQSAESSSIGPICPQNIGAIQQGPMYNIPLVMNSQPLVQTLNIPPISSTPIPQGPQESRLPNPSMQLFPAACPQNYNPPPPCRVTDDLSSVRLLSPQNLPQASPTLNCAPLFPTNVQPVAFPQSINPIDCVPIPTSQANAPYFQISALPSLLSFPNIQQSCNSFPINSLQTSDEYSPVPINLQINVPPSNVPAPKINVITVVPGPPNPASVPENPGVLSGAYPLYSLPPIIIEDTSSRSSNLLPIILMALFAGDGGGGGGGCCYCCNSGNSDIPVPFPIPIPTYNPIILGSPQCS